MAHAKMIKYSCANPECLKPDVGRDLLTVKKAVFLEMGPGGRTIRSRVVGWICPVCLAKDSDWTREKFLTPLLDYNPEELIRG